MIKKAILVLAIFAFVATGAFGQIVLGISGVQYYEKDPVTGKLPTLSEAWGDFKDGTGVYGGLFAELILGNTGLGLSFNQQTFEDAAYPDGSLDMWNYDVNLSVTNHIFGGRAFIDPFLQAGVGLFAYDYKNKEEAKLLHYPDLVIDDPLAGSAYFDFGLGLGVNFGSLGIFFKGMWNVQSNDPLYSQTDGVTPIFDLPVMPFKWVFGAKLIL